MSSKKQYKECVKYFLNNIDSEKYKEFCQKLELENESWERDYIRNEKPQWNERTDHYFKDESVVLAKMVFADVLSNRDVSKLIAKLYALPPRNFEVVNHYKKPSLIRKYDYIHMQYEGYGIGSIAEVVFKKDKYIDRIKISWTQINSFYAFVEYHFHFKRAFNEELYNEFIKDRISAINPRRDYYIWYRFSDDDKLNYITLNQMQDEIFALICQHYITSMLYSEQGRKNKLLSLSVYTRKKEIDIDKLYLPGTDITFFNKKENYAVVQDVLFNGNCEYGLLAGGNHIPQFSLLNVIGKYGNDFYNLFFGRREIKLFGYEFSQYTSGRKPAWYNRKFLKLLNKIQGMSESENKEFSDFYEEFDEKWVFFCANDCVDFKDYSISTIKDIKKIYEDNLNYLRIRSEITLSKGSFYTSIAAVIISLFAIILAA